MVNLTPSGMRKMVESDSKRDPLRENEKGDPGRKEMDCSETIFSEGCSLICWRAVRGEREARSFFILSCACCCCSWVCCCVAAVGAGAAAAGAGADAAGVGAEAAG